MVAQRSEEERGEYGPPADVYRRIARGFNRLDYPYAAVLLYTNREGGIFPLVFHIHDARDAWEWWGGSRLEGSFYGALFANHLLRPSGQWTQRDGRPAFIRDPGFAPPKLEREFLRGGKWLGPMPP